MWLLATFLHAGALLPAARRAARHMRGRPIVAMSQLHAHEAVHADQSTRDTNDVHAEASSAVHVDMHEGSAHVFVVHGDICHICADAVLIPTRNLNNRQWFPKGPPPGAVAPDRHAFTTERRVIDVMTAQTTRPQLWLGHLDGRYAPPELRDDVLGRPNLEWFLEAAEQFLQGAHDDLLLNRARPPRNGRQKHVLAMPVVGTGLGGARGSSGEILQQLLELLHSFTAAHDVDVCLVVNSGKMFSAAQAHRRQMAGLGLRWEASVGTRLCGEARRLAALAAGGQLGFKPPPNPDPNSDPNPNPNPNPSPYPYPNPNPNSNP